MQPGPGHVSVLVELIVRTVAAAEHAAVVSVAVVEPAAAAAAAAAGPDVAELGAEHDVVQLEPVLAPAVAVVAAAAAAVELVGSVDSVGPVAVELVAVGVVELELGLELGLDVVQLR